MRFGAFVTTTSRCVVVVEGRPITLEPVGGGYFEAFAPGAGHGDRYWLDLEGRRLPDPYAPYLPDGVHGPAMVWDPRHAWRHDPVVRPLREQVLYELHVGTFTPEGTYRAAADRLPALVDLGVTTIELMPVGAFSGRWGWGYDGVAAFAPHAAYGTPDDLRALVDRAHGLGLGVLLDVVYNHLGPSGAYLSAFSEQYFRSDRKTPWGDALDYRHEVTRRWLVESALRWLESYRFDGLRLDATFAIVDDSPVHVLRELADAVAELAPKKVLVAEDDRNDPRVVGELGMDAVWADDFHHHVRVTLTGEQDGYLGGYRPGVAGIAKAIAGGWSYQGQRYAPWGRPRGAPAPHLDAERFVYCVQNHDQVGNRAEGDRLHHLVPPQAWRAVSVLLLALPMTPLLFMGQEWAASSPFLYFTDHDAELGAKVTAGRRAEFPWHSGEVPDPQDPATFERSKLRWDERDRGDHAAVLALYRQVLALRRSDPVLSTVGRDGLRVEARGAVLVVELRGVAVLRWVVVNLGATAATMPEEVRGAEVLLATEPVDGPRLPPWAAVVLGRAAACPRPGAAAPR